MQYINYPHLLLCSTALSLLMSHAYAVTSPVTPGPSVGHRPVTTGLNLGTGNGAGGGNITLATTHLSVGNTIGLMAASGNDADGDADKAGAHCVWYRVDPNTQAETVVRDPGAADRNCHYTIQSADVGFKIKNVIKIFSDQDIATTKGFKLNPIDSWPVETVSANMVINQNNRPFDHIQLDGHKEQMPTTFPTTAYEGAQMQLALTSSSPPNSINSNYNWSSSSAPAVTVNGVGLVTFNNLPSKDGVNIVATAKDGTHSYSYYFKTPKFFITHPSGTALTKTESEKFCVSIGAYKLPAAADLSNGTANRQLGYLLNEWGSFTSRHPWNGGGYFTSKAADGISDETVSLHNGYIGRIALGAAAGVICMKSL